MFGDRVGNEDTGLESFGWQLCLGTGVAGLVFVVRVGEEDTVLDVVGVLVHGPGIV